MLQEWAGLPGDQSGGGLQLCREQVDRSRWRGIGLGGMRASVGSLSGWLIEPDEEAGFIIKVDRQLVCPSSSSTSSPSPSPSASWLYLKENLGCVQDAWPRPNWILTEDTTLEGERSEEGREDDRCIGTPRLPRPRPLPGIWGESADWGSTRCPPRVSWLCLARIRALRTGEDGAGGGQSGESSKNAFSSWASSSAPTPSVGDSVSVAVSVWFWVC